MEEIRQKAEELSNTVSDKKVKGLIYHAFIEGAKYMEMRKTQEAPKCNHVTLINYLDEHRPAGKMCMSNMECEDLERAFCLGSWEKVIRYIKKMNSYGVYSKR